MPDYSKYTIAELEGVLQFTDRDKYPERFAAVTAELRIRHSAPDPELVSGEVLAGKPSAAGIGTWLKVWLSLSLLGSAGSVLLFVLRRHDSMQAMDPTLPDWTPVYYLAKSVCYAVFVVAIFRSRKWGIIGYLAIFTIGFFFDIFFGVPLWQTLLGFVGLVMFIILARPLWTRLQGSN
jgi:hypothetical protein